MARSLFGSSVPENKYFPLTRASIHTGSVAVSSRRTSAFGFDGAAGGKGPTPASTRLADTSGAAGCAAGGDSGLAAALSGGRPGAGFAGAGSLVAGATGVAF